MANYANVLSFVLVIAFLITLNVEARESKYFSKFDPRLDQPSFKPSSETKNFNDFQFENPDSTDIPPQEFIESMKKDSSEGTNDFARDFDRVTLPDVVSNDFKSQDYKEDVVSNNFNDFKTQGYKEDVISNDFKSQDYKEDVVSNDFNYPKLNPTEGVRKTDASANDDGFELTDEEKKFFNAKEGMNSFKTNDGENFHAQGMSDTRTLENGKYFYNPRVMRGNSQRATKYFGNREENKAKTDEFRPLKDFEYTENQVGLP